MRRWYLGIQSKKDPAHVMTEVYKAMFALDCTWNQVTNYRVLCLWKLPEVAIKTADDASEAYVSAHV